MTGVSAGEVRQQPDIPDDEQQLEDSTMEVGEADVDYADQVLTVLFAVVLVRGAIGYDQICYFVIALPFSKVYSHVLPCCAAAWLQSTSRSWLFTRLAG